jgi:hypothetical protein
MNAAIAIADQVTAVVNVCIFISPRLLGEPPAGGLGPICWGQANAANASTGIAKTMAA